MPKFITLEEIKKQCVIDPDFHEDDDFLEMLGDSAEDMASKLLVCDLEELVAEKGELPATVRHAIRMLVDYMYSQNRGSSGDSIDVPNAVYTMLKLYRKFA